MVKTYKTLLKISFLATFLLVALFYGFSAKAYYYNYNYNNYNRNQQNVPPSGGYIPGTYPSYVDGAPQKNYNYNNYNYNYNYSRYPYYSNYYTPYYYNYYYPYYYNYNYYNYGYYGRYW